MSPRRPRELFNLTPEKTLEIDRNNVTAQLSAYGIVINHHHFPDETLGSFCDKQYIAIGSTNNNMDENFMSCYSQGLVRLYMNFSPSLYDGDNKLMLVFIIECLSPLNPAEEDPPIELLCYQDFTFRVVPTEVKDDKLRAIIDLPNLAVLTPGTMAYNEQLRFIFYLRRKTTTFSLFRFYGVKGYLID